MLEWLEDRLDAFRGAALVVSHDRAFLDNTVNTILELDPVSHYIKTYPGNYTDYIDQKSTEREHHANAWQDQQDEIAQLRAAAAHLRGMTVMKKGGDSSVTVSPRVSQGRLKGLKHVSINCSTSRKLNDPVRPGS
jgi:ATPase subunit of ABC transporter with duplicated ATPase domains